MHFGLLELTKEIGRKTSRKTSRIFQDSNRWRPIQKDGSKRITIAQRIERQAHLKKYLDPKSLLKPKSVISKYYRLRKKGRLPAHQSVFKNVSLIGRIKRTLQGFSKIFRNI